jgi:hypothetical protein
MGTSLLLIGGPAVLVVGWIVLIASAGQGAGDGWFVGHYLLFLANATWLPITIVLTHLAGRGVSVADPVLWLVLVGSLAVAGQLAIDLAAWALSLDAAALTTFFAELRQRPLLSLTMHTVGPSLLFLGLFLAALRLGRARREATTGAALIGVGILVVLGGALLTYSLVILAGYVAVLAGFAVLAWRHRMMEHGADLAG